VRYLTVGVNLYEVVSEQHLQNAGTYERSGGRHGQYLNVTYIFDVVTQRTTTLREIDMACLTEVRVS
jgi:hypothetical protein